MNKTPSSHIEPNQKLRNLEQEKAQAEHRSQRLQNRERYLSEGARKKRTHHLCNMGGAIEALCPQIAALNKTDFTASWSASLRFPRCRTFFWI